MNTQPSQPFIIVGADGSVESSAALHWAVDQAALINARVIVVTAFTVPVTIMVTPTYTDEDYARDAQECLDLTVSRADIDSADVSVESRLVEDRPAVALTTMARGAELLVVGAKGHGELPGLHLGSVASYCAHHAPCPVVVHRS
ncbi:MAG: universal stress protein [Candidatus Nanopelagicales bacterium]|nr:universal stress protein [Candidatus Nanopelagicales bacterium]MCF8536982.1 universal stress protein [Candidatus Nanopelagicales bacterium]MCF8543407.1 universal stress protein [Candidatus Nanopelagicales bacterium]MCF8556839.1 universal stress protein [Candidatus Nanopelagicales bacterium]